MRVRVAPSSIKNGIAVNCENCPLALSIRAAVNQLAGDDIFSVTVGPDFVDFYERGELIDEVPLPPVAILWRQRFDEIRKGDPFEFELELTARLRNFIEQCSGVLPNK